MGSRVSSHLMFRRRMFRKHVGEQLRTARVSLNLSQEEVAWAADVTQGSISNYENGRSEIPMSVLIEICSALNVRPVDLIPALATRSQLVLE